MDLFANGAVWVVKRAKQHKHAIFKLNWWAIAHDFWGGPEGRAYFLLKINRAAPRRLGRGLVWAFFANGAIWVVKWAKRRNQAIFKPNRCAIAHDFWDGPRGRAYFMLKIDWATPPRLESSLV
ncbi:hypothetical protein P3S68_033797 [Capsicum galapagoense]